MSEWCFAIVNGRLAEIYFENDDKNRKSKIFGHSYIKENDYKTKLEKKWIMQDTTKYKIVFGNKKYRIVG